MNEWVIKYFFVLIFKKLLKAGPVIFFKLLKAGTCKYPWRILGAVDFLVCWLQYDPAFVVAVDVVVSIIVPRCKK